MDAIVNIFHIIVHYFHVNDRVEESLLKLSQLLFISKVGNLSQW